jgi:hypothetical protein
MSNRNFVVLLYSVSTASVTITMLLTLVFVSIALSTLPGERSQQSQAPSLFFPLNTSLGIIQYVYATSVVVSFVLLWSCTVMLLQKVRKSKAMGHPKPSISSSNVYFFLGNSNRIEPNIQLYIPTECG